MFQINYRYPLINVAAYASRVSPKANYKSSREARQCLWPMTDGYKPPFRAISKDYFARELHRELASEAVVFCLLALTTIPPLINAASALLGILKAF